MSSPPPPDAAQARRIECIVHPDLVSDPQALAHFVARKHRICADSYERIVIERRSVDARRGRVRVHLRLRLDPPKAPLPTPLCPKDPPKLAELAPVAIVGMGPAGLFCALRLAEQGIASQIFERGKDVQARRKDLALLHRSGELNPESNYCFGEGGAGTYSDGKLYTRSAKRGSVPWILERLAQHGAPADILVNARPHVGTNRLPKVITSMRRWLLDAGVKIHFDCRVDGLIKKGERVVGLKLHDGSVVPCRHAVVCSGHSAPDVLRWLEQAGASLKAKPFAAGIRIEHPQGDIDRAQYGELAGHPALGAASYRLVEQVLERSVHSFCMCPGGVIVPSSTLRGKQVVNGMSPYERRGQHANSGFVVQIEAQHLAAAGFDPADHWSGQRYLEALEARAYQAGGGDYVAPAQMLRDLCAQRESKHLSESSYHRGMRSSDLAPVLRELFAPIRAALTEIDAKIPNFLGPEAVALGVESRTSSPIQIPRDPKNLQTLGLSGLYACGEGAGFAGGIVSAAIDGQRVADAIARLGLS